MNHPDLFISHSSVDAEAAETLVADLEKAGLSCWLASRDVPLGGAYQAEIVNAIEHCRAVLLVFSEAANKSEHVLREVELAAQGKKAIYPLRIDRSEPVGGLKYMLANKQWVERKALGGRLPETIVRLLKGATPAPAGEATAQPPSPPMQPVPAGSRAARPVVVGGAGLLAVGLVGGAAWLAAQGGLWPQQDRTASPGNTPRNIEQPSGPQRAATPPEARPSPVVLPTAPADLSALGEGVHLFRECDVCPVMAVVPAGQAMIGSPDHELGRSSNEGPQQSIVVRRPFAVGRSEVSFEEWLACVAEGGCNAHRPGDYGWGHGKQPVINVSWSDAKAYVEWLSRKTGKPYRLLSEAEWEYAARGCVSARCVLKAFWFGAEISPERANYDWRYSYDGSRKAQPPRRTVATDGAEPNPFGLLHVHGNVREWVEDCWNASLAGLPGDGSARKTGDCSSHVTRGGSWSDEPKDLRAATRSWEVTKERSAQIGFRVARSLTP